MVAFAKATFARDFTARVKSAREVAYSRSEMETLLRLPKGAYKKYETRALLPHHLVRRFCLLTGIDPSELYFERIEEPISRMM